MYAVHVLVTLGYGYGDCLDMEQDDVLMFLRIAAKHNEELKLQRK